MVCTMGWFLQTFTVCLFMMLVNQIQCENQELNTRPVIGIAAMAITDQLHIEILPHLHGRSYVASSYVKFLELAGARVVVIPPNIKIEEEKKLFNNINGLLFPGGEVNLKDSGYFHATHRLFQLASEANTKDNYFPVLGICRGMQAIIVHTVRSISPLSLTDARNFPTTLQFYEDASESKLLRDISKELFVKHTTKNLTAHFHKYGFTPKTFTEIDVIKEQYKIIATSKDRDGLEFVSIYEGKNHPYFGLQFHPEKTMFEWAEKLNIPHELDAIKFSQLIADNFVQEARKNSHRISDEVEDKYLLTKQIPIYTGFMKNSHSPFQQIYVY